MGKIDWTVSGRIDRYSFETISNTVKNIKTAKSTGKLDYVTGFTLSWSYSSSNKVSGTLDVEKQDPLKLNNNLVRIYYMPKLSTATGTATQKILLATMYMSATEGRYEDGLYSGKVTLKSTLCRFTDDHFAKPFALSKNKKASYQFRLIHRLYGGWYVWDGARDYVRSSNKVEKFGDTIMTALQDIAGTRNQISVDEYGRTVIRRYYAPSSRSIGYNIPYGSKSVTLPGIDIKSTADGTPNRVAASVTWRPSGSKTDKTLYSVAEVASSKTFSKKSTGRWITNAYLISDLSSNTQAQLNKRAKTLLKEATDTETTYTFECFYLPIKIGNIVRFRYGKINKKCIVTNIEYSASQNDPALTMKVTVRSV